MKKVVTLRDETLMLRLTWLDSERSRDAPGGAASRPLPVVERTPQTISPPPPVVGGHYGPPTAAVYDAQKCTYRRSRNKQHPACHCHWSRLRCLQHHLLTISTSDMLVLGLGLSSDVIKNMAFKAEAKDLQKSKFKVKDKDLGPRPRPVKKTQGQKQRHPLTSKSRIHNDTLL